MYTAYKCVLRAVRASILPPGLPTVTHLLVFLVLRRGRPEVDAGGAAGSAGLPPFSSFAGGWLCVPGMRTPHPGKSFEFCSQARSAAEQRGTDREVIAASCPKTFPGAVYARAMRVIGRRRFSGTGTGASTRPRLHPQVPPGEPSLSAFHSPARFASASSGLAEETASASFTGRAKNPLALRVDKRKKEL